MIAENTTSQVIATRESEIYIFPYILRLAQDERKILRHREGSFLINALGDSLFLQDLLSKI